MSREGSWDPYSGHPVEHDTNGNQYIDPEQNVGDAAGTADYAWAETEFVGGNGAPGFTPEVAPNDTPSPYCPEARPLVL